MSDFIDIVPELLKEIIKIHWDYFDTEESIVKLEERKKLEDCLKNYLYIVQHDKKFFLPVTKRVLRNSIKDLDDFNAKNGITAFEAISQYANNLYTKPWRKEYRILKMYSGFYQHEVKSNLLKAETLFEAMGYRRLSNDILIFDGPICPDQVANVSRDAMIAYVELQIIKHIHTGLDALGINCSWWDIYCYREKHTGDHSEAVKGIANAIEQKRYRSRQKALLSDNYGYIDVQPSANYFTNNSQFCPPQCQCSMYQQLQPSSVNRHRSVTQPINDSMCCVPEHQQTPRTTGNLIYSNMTYPAQQHYHHNHQYADVAVSPLSQMSHSRSLEHYSEPSHQNHRVIVPHRHSFDHQQQGCTAHHQHHNQTPLNTQHHQLQQNYYQHLNHQQQQPQNVYESPYDSIDGNSITGGGGSSISYAAVAANAGGSTAASASGVNGGVNFNPNSPYSQPYNVSGNRIPLPLNISNQLSAYDLPASTSSTYMAAPQDPNYAHIAEQHLYSSVSKLPQNCVMPTSTYNPNTTYIKDSRQQRSYGNESLIDFEERTAQQLFDPLQQYRNNYETPISNNAMDKHYNMANLMENSLPNANVTNCAQHYVSGLQQNPNDDMYVYAKPVPRENRKPLQNTINSRKYSYNSTERGGDTTDLSYESANEDFNNLSGLESQSQHSHSPTQLTKNQDGVGSYETWNYVFQNLERSGYSKDLGDRKDLLVESLDLDSLNINNETLPNQNSTADKRRSNYAGNDNNSKLQQQQQQPLPDIKHKSRTFQNSKCSTKPNAKSEILASASSSQKLKTSMDNNVGKKMKSTLKQPTNATSNSKTNYNSGTNNINQFNNKPNNQTKTNDNKSSTSSSSAATSTVHKKTMNNNNNIQESLTTTTTNASNGTTTQTKKSSNASSKKSTTNVNNGTQIIITGDNEWSCSFCTFLNPNTTRICEMCSHTKDFKMRETTNTSTSAAAAATTGANITHNTTTCA